MFSFQTKNPEFVSTLEGLAVEDVVIIYDHLVNFPAIWYMFLLFGTFLPVLVCCDKKNLATLLGVMGATLT
jgi:hypothetical protein